MVKLNFANVLSSYPKNEDGRGRTNDDCCEKQIIKINYNLDEANNANVVQRCTNQWYTTFLQPFYRSWV